MTPGTLVVIMALMWAAMLVVLLHLLGSMEHTERQLVALDPPRRGSGRQRRG